MKENFYNNWPMKKKFENTFLHILLHVLHFDFFLERDNGMCNKRVVFYKSGFEPPTFCLKMFAIRIIINEGNEDQKWTLNE